MAGGGAGLPARREVPGETLFGNPAAARYWLAIWMMDSVPAGWLPFLIGAAAGWGLQRLLPATPG